MIIFGLTIQEISNILMALAAICGASVAVYGVREWKRQMKGRTDYEIARRYLRAALTLRDAMAWVRNPFVPVGEMQRALKEEGFNSEEYGDHQKTNRAVYVVRWKKVQEARSAWEAESLEAEVSWGKAAINASKNLDMAVRELFSAVSMHIGDYDLKTDRDIIYDQSTPDKPDPFTRKVEASINTIREFLKPHLL